jgi:hypothetical protein
MNSPKLLHLSLAVAISLSPLMNLRAQDTDESARMLNSIGAAGGQSLYATFMAVNTLGDAWTGKVYDNEKTMQMAGSYGGGTKAMRDSFAALLKNSKTLSQEDRDFITGMVESCDLILEQLTAFQSLLQGDKAAADVFEAKRKEARAKIFGLLGINIGDDDAASAGGGGGARDLVFKISKSTNGKPGTVRFVREAEGKTFNVTWQYEDGSKDTGIGLPFPETGVIAVGFGPDVLAIALYKLDGKSVDAKWAAYQAGADIGEYQMTQGADKTAFNIEGGGTVSIVQGRERTANVSWNLATGTYKGIAVAEGDYLAAVSLKPGGKGGVAIYTADVAKGTASGRWTMSGTAGVGEETLQIISANGQSVGASDDAGGGAAAEVRAIAESLRDDAAKTLIKLRPSAKDIAAITANTAAAKALQAYSDEVFQHLDEIGRVAKPGQTEINVFTGDDLPGGYAEQAGSFKPGINIYGFEYLEPGKTAGMSYDGVVNVGGRWIMIPKMWRAFAK